jgi:biotin carboxylase
MTSSQSADTPCFLEKNKVRVLIVGTNRACHKQLFSHGHEAVLFMPKSKVLPEDLAGPFLHVVVLEDHANMQLWVDAAAACHEATPFDAVVAYNENTYLIAHAISTRLKVPCTVDVDLFARVLDKSQMRHLLEEHDIPSCRHAFAQGREAVANAIRAIGMPCIVKPVDGEASRGVSKVASADDVEAALQWMDEEQVERGVIVEEFLAGDEYSVEAMSTNDRHHILAITKKFKDDRTFVERGHLVPAPLDATVQATIEKYVTRVLDAFDFHDCPSHTELMLTPSGPRIIETHNRIGGDRIMDLVHHATGIDMYDLAARQSIGGDISSLLPATISRRQFAAIWYADPSVPDTQKLVEVRGIDHARALPYVKTLDLLKKPGSRGAMLRHSFDRSALAIAVGETDVEALDRARGAIRSLEFLYVWAPDPEIS